MFEFNNKIKSFIETHALLKNSNKVLVAVSGGVDSMVLLDVMAKLKQTKITVVHINHNLRGAQSDADELLVKQTAQKLGVDFFAESVDVKEFAKQNALSIETAARILRLKTFGKYLKSAGSDAVVTGHHADDNIETVIHRLLRGTGFKGLCGIHPQRTIEGMTVISPMLCVSRDQIVEYAKQNDIKWRLDHSNNSVEYTRNKIRHLLLPELNKKSNDLSEKISSLSEKCRSLNSKIEVQAKLLQAFKQNDNGVEIDIEIMQKQNKLVQAEILRTALIKSNCGLGDITQIHYEAIMELCDKPGTKQIELPGGFVAEKLFTKIQISKLKNKNHILKSKSASAQIRINLPGQTVYQHFQIECGVLEKNSDNLNDFIRNKDEFVEWFDADKICGDIIVRRRNDGDKFVPIGMKTEKKVGKFITTDKPDYNVRDNILIFTDSKHIIWVCPLRASEKTKIDDSTTKILEIRVTHK